MLKLSVMGCFSTDFAKGMLYIRTASLCVGLQIQPAYTEHVLHRRSIGLRVQGGQLRGPPLPFLQRPAKCQHGCIGQGSSGASSVRECGQKALICGKLEWQCL